MNSRDNVVHFRRDAELVRAALVTLAHAKTHAERREAACILAVYGTGADAVRGWDWLRINEPHKWRQLWDDVKTEVE